jgi:Rap1a immunity proteins
MRKLYRATAAAFTVALITSTAQAAGADISARNLLSSWHDEDPGMRMVAEVIASAFASGFSWGGDAAGKRVYCASPEVKGDRIMSAFEEFLKNNPKMTEEPYGAAMAGTLSKAFPCHAQ